MKILIFIPTLEIGGAERVVSRLATIWSGYKGVKIFVCLLRSNDNKFILPDNVQIITLKSSKNKIINKSLLLFRLRRTIFKLKPDVIQSFMTEYNLIMILSLLGSKQRIFISDRANPLVKKSNFLEISKKLLYPKAKGIIAQTELAKKTLQIKTNNNRIKVIPNPLKITTEICNYNAKVILNVGRLVKEKGQIDLIDAFKNTENKDGWKLIIVGDGPLKSTLEEKILKENIANVEIIGFKQNVEDYYKNSSVFAFSSYSEGYPNAIIEAMAYGLPVVSFDCPSGPSEIITHEKNGFLVELGNVVLFSHHLQNLMDNYDLRVFIGSNAKNDISLNSEELIAKKWFNFIKENE